MLRVSKSTYDACIAPTRLSSRAEALTGLHRHCGSSIENDCAFRILEIDRCGLAKIDVTVLKGDGTREASNSEETVVIPSTQFHPYQ
jgi:hypothetical protein